MDHPEQIHSEQAREKFLGKSAEERLQKLVERLAQTETRLATLTERMEQTANETATEPTDPATQPERRAGMVLVGLVSLLALGATLVVIMISLYLAALDPGSASNNGVAASFNQELVGTLHAAELYANLRAYSTYRLHSELQQQLAVVMENASAEEDIPSLEHEHTQARQLAAVSHLFFPLRYLNRDGSYASDRQLGEAWAHAAQSTDLNPQPHFLKADTLRLTGLQLVWLLLWMTVALCVYELVQFLNHHRRLLRLFAVAGATAAVLFVTISVWAIRQTP